MGSKRERSDRAQTSNSRNRGAIGGRRATVAPEVRQTSARVIIRPLAILTAYENNREANDRNFVLARPSILFPQVRTAHNAGLDTTALIERISSPGGIDSQTWGRMPAEAVAGLMAEVALEANSRGIPLALDEETTYEILGGGRGRSLSGLRDYVIGCMEGDGIFDKDPLSYLLGDLGLSPASSDKQAATSPHEKVAADERAGLGDRPSPLGDAPGLPDAGHRREDREAAPVSALELLAGFIGSADPKVGEEISEAAGIVGAAILQQGEHPDEIVVVELPRKRFAFLDVLNIEGRPAVELLTRAAAEVAERDVRTLSVRVAAEEPREGLAASVTAEPLVATGDISSRESREGEVLGDARPAGAAQQSPVEDGQAEESLAVTVFTSDTSDATGAAPATDAATLTKISDTADKSPGGGEAGSSEESSLPLPGSGNVPAKLDGILKYAKENGEEFGTRVGIVIDYLVRVAADQRIPKETRGRRVVPRSSIEYLVHIGGKETMFHLISTAVLKTISTWPPTGEVSITDLVGKERRDLGRNKERFLPKPVILDIARVIVAAKNGSPPDTVDVTNAGIYKDLAQVGGLKGLKNLLNDDEGTTKPKKPVNPKGYTHKQRLNRARIVVRSGGTVWQILAECANVNPDTMFPQTQDALEKAQNVCAGCLVKGLCGAHALEHGEEHGVWGGESEEERANTLSLAKGNVTGIAASLKSSNLQDLEEKYGR